MATAKHDPRRFTGPESATPYFDLRVDPPAKASKAQAASDIRPLFLTTDLLSKAQGSAYVEQGGTKVLCSVFGPREIPRRSDFSMKGVLSVQYRSAPFSHPHQRLSGQHEAQSTDNELGLVLEGALQATICLHLYPKSQIDVIISVLENDGSTLAAAITCAGLALANASVHMFDLVIGSSLCRRGDKVVFDPDLDEELDESVPDGESSFMTIGYQPSLEQMVVYQHEGISSPATIAQDMEHLAKKCKEIVPNVQKSLLDSLKAKTQTT